MSAGGLIRAEILVIPTEEEAVVARPVRSVLADAA